MLRFGRQRRARDPRVPHMSALLAGCRLPSPPIAVDYTALLPASLGMMLNGPDPEQPDLPELNDCTCAGVYHAMQVWTANAGKQIYTASSAVIEQLYENACGYVPGNPASDEGGVEQVVLGYWLTNGAPMDGGAPPEKLAAFVEVDGRNVSDMKLAIADCGVVYIGIDVPAYIMDPATNLTRSGSVWDVSPKADNTIVGRHAVILAGYDTRGARLISWGRVYIATWAFLAQRIDEAYALGNALWINERNVTPFGQTLAQLVEQMDAIREAA